MKRTIPKKKGEDTVALNVQIPISLDEKLAGYVKANNTSKKQVTVDGIAFIIGDRIEAQRTDISFDLSDDDEKAALQKLADDAKIGDPNVFVRWLTRMAIEKGADATIRFLFGQLEEKVEEQRAKDEARIKAQSKARGNAQKRNVA